MKDKIIIGILLISLVMLSGCKDTFDPEKDVCLVEGFCNDKCWEERYNCHYSQKWYHVSLSGCPIQDTEEEFKKCLEWEQK